MLNFAYRALALAFVAAVVSGADVAAQQTPAQIYDQRYNRNDYSRPYTYDNLARATVDTQFYHRPSVSPYLNLFRPTTGGAASNYYTFVQPEQNRREAIATQQLSKQLQPFTPGGGNLSTARSSAGNVQVTPAPRQGIVNSSYYKQFYGLQ
jgi:hypothetical protein